MRLSYFCRVHKILQNSNHPNLYGYSQIFLTRADILSVCLTLKDSSPKNENSVIIYSLSGSSKNAYISLFS